MNYQDIKTSIVQSKTHNCFEYKYEIDSLYFNYGYLPLNTVIRKNFHLYGIEYDTNNFLKNNYLSFDNIIPYCLLDKNEQVIVNNYFFNKTNYNIIDFYKVKNNKHIFDFNNKNLTKKIFIELAKITIINSFIKEYLCFKNFRKIYNINKFEFAQDYNNNNKCCNFDLWFELSKESGELICNKYGKQFVVEKCYYSDNYMICYNVENDNYWNNIFSFIYDYKTNKFYFKRENKEFVVKFN